MYIVYTWMIYANFIGVNKPYCAFNFCGTKKKKEKKNFPTFSRIL